MSSPLSRSNTARRSISSMSTTSTSLSHAINSIDSSKPAVVIDIGAKLTKCGFAGEYVPRAILRTVFVDNASEEKTTYQLNEMLIRPNVPVLYQFFKGLFYNNLLCMPRERRVVVVESVLSPTVYRKALCKVLMELLDVPSVLFVPGHLCATFPFNTEFALVIDVGHSETIALPVAEGVTMLSSWEVSSVSMSRIEGRVRELLTAHGKVEREDGERRAVSSEDWIGIDNANLIEDISVRFVFCTTAERGKLIQEGGVTTQLDPSPKDVRLPFGKNFLVVPGFVREAACEVLFEVSNADELSLPMMIHQLIAKLAIDLRKKMFESILMIGGTTLIPGFLARLKSELKRIGAERSLKTCEEIKFFRFQQQHVELFAAWLGGSMFGSMQDAVQLRSLSRDTWMANGQLPDWTDGIENTTKDVPGGKPEAER